MSPHSSSIQAWGRALKLLIALLAALATILGFAIVSASAAGVAETRVGAFNSTVEPAVGPPQHIAAGQSRDAAEDQPLAQAGEAMTTTERHGVVADGDLSSLPATRAAAKPGTAIEKWAWPPNRAFMHDPAPTTLKAGTIVDRYGRQGGTFVSPKGPHSASGRFRLSRPAPPTGSTKSSETLRSAEALQHRGLVRLAAESSMSYPNLSLFSSVAGFSRRWGDNMDRETLKSLLDAEDVDPAAYSLDGGLPFEAYVLERRPCGWAIYYSQRGLRTNEEPFVTENEACARLLELILRDSTTRRSP